MTPAERFWSNVNKRGPNECWEWLLCTNRDGYGASGTGAGRMMLSHRRAWELTHGAIPIGDGLHGVVVMHSCDNRKCCNPAHLSLGSRADNSADCVRKRRHEHGSTHHKAKLDETDVKLIRFLRRIGARNKDVASWFAMSPQAVSLANNGTYWGHVA